MTYSVVSLSKKKQKQYGHCYQTIVREFIVKQENLQYLTKIFSAEYRVSSLGTMDSIGQDC